VRKAKQYCNMLIELLEAKYWLKNNNKS
jgi:hypothetical protein